MNCAACGIPFYLVPLRARGLCTTCYDAWWRRPDSDRGRQAAEHIGPHRDTQFTVCECSTPDLEPIAGFGDAYQCRTCLRPPVWSLRDVGMTSVNLLVMVAAFMAVWLAVIAGVIAMVPR